MQVGGRSELEIINDIYLVFFTCEHNGDVKPTTPSCQPGLGGGT